MRPISEPVTPIWPPSDGVAGDKFGSSVDVSGDWIIVGSPIDGGSQGSAYLFLKPANGWVTDTGQKTCQESAGKAGEE